MSDEEILVELVETAQGYMDLFKSALLHRAKHRPDIRYYTADPLVNGMTKIAVVLQSKPDFNTLVEAIRFASACFDDHYHTMDRNRIEKEKALLNLMLESGYT